LGSLCGIGAGLLNILVTPAIPYGYEGYFGTVGASGAIYGVMVAARGEGTEPVKLEDVAGKTKFVPLDHPWLASARYLGVSLGD